MLQETRLERSWIFLARLSQGTQLKFILLVESFQKFTGRTVEAKGPCWRPRSKLYMMSLRWVCSKKGRLWQCLAIFPFVMMEKVTLRQHTIRRILQQRPLTDGYCFKRDITWYMEENFIEAETFFGKVDEQSAGYDAVIMDWLCWLVFRIKHFVDTRVEMPQKI